MGIEDDARSKLPDVIFDWLFDNFAPNEEFTSSLGMARLYNIGEEGTVILEASSKPGQPRTMSLLPFDAVGMYWEDLCDRLKVGAEPEEGDYVIGPNGFILPLGETIAEHDAAIARIKEQMELDQFWPNVWLQDDHGGFTLLDVTEGEGG